MSVVQADELQKRDGTLPTPAETVHYGTCRARLRVNQAGTQTILDSFNISSITDDGSGKTTGSFTNVMAGADWVGAVFSNGNASGALWLANQGGLLNRTANDFQHVSAGGGTVDSIYCDNVVFGDLA